MNRKMKRIPQAALSIFETLCIKTFLLFQSAKLTVWRKSQTTYIVILSIVILLNYSQCFKHNSQKQFSYETRPFLSEFLAQ